MGKRYDGLYGSTDGAATRTRQLVGTVDPYIEYSLPVEPSTACATVGSTSTTKTTMDRATPSHVFYSEYQVQQRGDAWGLDNLVLTGGAVHQLTLGQAELYNGGRPEGSQQSRNRVRLPAVDQKAGERLNLSAGTRYEHFSINDSTASKPVFRAGLNFQAAEATWFRASVGQGFRFPTIAEKFIRTGLGPLQVYPSNDCDPRPPSTLKPGSSKASKWADSKGLWTWPGSTSNTRTSSNSPLVDGTQPSTDSSGRKWVPQFEHGKQPRDGMGNVLDGPRHLGETTVDLLAGYTYTNPISLTPDLPTTMVNGHRTLAVLTYNTPASVGAPYELNFVQAWTPPAPENKC